MKYYHVVETISSAIQIAINEIKDKLPYDKSYTGRITGRQGFTYTVMIHGINYRIKSGFDFDLDSSVKVTALQNNHQQLYLNPLDFPVKNAGRAAKSPAEKTLYFDSDAGIMTSIVCFEDLTGFDVIGLLCHMDGSSFYTRAVIQNGQVTVTLPGWNPAGYPMTYRVLMEANGRNLTKTSELACGNGGISETNRLRVLAVFGWRQNG